MGFPRTYITGIIFFFASISVAAASSNTSLEIYEVDFKYKTISVRLRPHLPADSGIDEYSVFFTNDKEVYDKKNYPVSKKLECTLWEDSVCFEKHPLSESIKSEDDWTSTKYEIQIYGDKAGERQQTWNTTFKPSSYNKASTMPMNFTYTNHSQGMVTLMWRHPLFPNKKIQQFEIVILQKKSALLSQPVSGRRRILNTTIKEEKKKYMEKLWLFTATEYDIEIFALNPDYSKKLEMTFYVASDVVFASGAIPEVTNNGTLIDFKIPAMVNVTSKTFFNISMKGIVTCAGEDTPLDWSAREGKVFENELISQIFDANETESGCYLNHGRTYEIKVEIIEKNSNIRKTFLHGHSISFPAIDSNGQPIPEVKGSIWPWLGIAACFIAIIFLALLLLAYKRYPTTYQTTQVLKPSIPQRPSYLEIISPSSTTALTNDSITLDTLKISLHPESTENRSSDHLYTMPNEPDSCAVSIEDFDKYAKNAASSKLLYSQFKRLQIGLTSPCEYGKSPENIPKNRSLNLIAYDDTRVILEKIPGDPYSDYINATYIKGYKKERAYIAAQGPTSNTVNDFWRMVWEQKVRVMCMLTNVTEGTETKCEKYWPDVGARTKHGDFLISNIDEQVFADYTFRTFELNFEREMRKVTHLHFTGWPSLGVPKNHQSLVAYLRKLEQTPTGNGPILVHCSTGDDRTGTVILCDICLRQAVAEKAMDVMAVASRMRDSRANMVGTVQQYVLAHIIITESSVSWPTQIPCTEVLSSRMNQLRIRLPFDIQRLKDSAWQQQALRASALAGPPISEYLTDGSPEGIYDDVFEEERNQIHAVSVDGIRANKQNWACWLPPPLTLPDFWEFVAERNIKLIIILQCSDPGNPSCYDIIPDESVVLPTLRIEMNNRTSLDNREYFTREELLLFNTSQENDRSQTVTVLTCRGWRCGMVQKPPDPPALISLWKASERIPRKEGQTLVLCHDSITACGLYLALSFLLERMTVERECDVIAAVRAVRRSKPEYVQSMEQIEYLYDAAVNYVESFQTYANFR